MKIIVCVKQVPARDSVLRVGSGSDWINETELSFEMNEPDAYALEEALQLKEKHGGEVVVVSAGPESASQVIREALAKGADRAIHIVLPSGTKLDALGTAKLLHSAVEAENADLILTGLQSDDMGFGQTGVILAELLGIPHTTIVMQVDVEGQQLKVKRELEDGWFQYIHLPLPALLTVQSGIKRLRYATLMGIKKAKTKEVRTIEAGPAEPGGITRVYSPERKKESQIFSGDVAAAARQLVEKLRFEARVL